VAVVEVGSRVQADSPMTSRPTHSRFASLVRASLTEIFYRATWTAIALCWAIGLNAHDPNATLTWNREVSRIVYERCASCHRPGGTAFSLLTYQDAQPHGSAIKDSVLMRTMPPWGAVKGFGDFRNDEGLTQDQIGIITDWVETGMLKGNNPNVLPPVPKFDKAPNDQIPSNGVVVRGDQTLGRPMTVDGIYPRTVPDGASMQIVAALPDGRIVPLIWLYEYKDRYRHPFLFRRPIALPAGTSIRGVRPDAEVLLMPKS
jgi:hypothetical protein